MPDPHCAGDQPRRRNVRPAVATHRARLAGLISTRGPDAPEVRIAREDYAATLLDQAVDDALPRVRAEHVDRLVDRLRAFSATRTTTP